MYALKPCSPLWTGLSVVKREAPAVAKDTACVCVCVGKGVRFIDAA